MPPTQLKSCHLCPLEVLPKNMSRHLRIKHGIQRKKSDSFLCECCKKTFARKENVKRHIVTQHNMSRSSSGEMKKIRGTLRCPLCVSSFSKMNKLDDHLTSKHDFNSDSKTLQFSTFEDFRIFKKAIERDQPSFYRKVRTKSAKIYYSCHRSGCSAPSKITKKLRVTCNKSGKLSATCPARMITTSTPNGISVFCQLSHAGHTCSADYLRITKDERYAIAGKIKMGVSFNEILSDVRNSDQMKRSHLVNKRDLRNICREFNLNSYVKKQNSAVNVDSGISVVTPYANAMSAAASNYSKVPEICVVNRAELREQLLLCLGSIDSISEESADRLLRLVKKINVEEQIKTVTNLPRVSLPCERSSFESEFRHEHGCIY